MKLNSELKKMFSEQLMQNLNQGKISSLPDDIIYKLSTFLRKDNTEDVFPIFGIKKRSNQATFETLETTKSTINFRIIVKYECPNSIKKADKVLARTMMVKLITATFDVLQKTITFNHVRNNKLIKSIINEHIPDTFSCVIINI
jgi:hypothetical protein